MANRAPNRAPRPLTCDHLRELAAAYLPVLQFSENERYFPLQVESWLGHATAADWVASDRPWHDDDLIHDPRQRGTAVLEERSDGRTIRRAGPPDPSNRPLLLPGSGGQPALAEFGEAGDAVFLSFAGWLDEARRTGDPEYLYRAFSEQAASIGTSNTWEAFDLEPNRPVLWVPQPVSPTVYAEIERVAAHVDLDRSLHDPAGDFPAEEGGARLTDLDGFLCVTYHYFFALADHVPGTDAPPRREGQWETASLYFPLGDQPGEPEVSEPPVHVVLTQGRQGDRHVRQPVPWSQMRVIPAGGDTTQAGPGADGTQPLVFVAEGTHRLFHDPAGTPPPATGVPPLGFTLGGGMDAGSRFWLTIAFLVWVLAVLAWGVAAILALIGLLAAAAVLGVIFAVLVALFIIIAILVALFGGSDPSTTADPDTQESDPDGPTAGDTSDPAGADAPPGSGGSSGGGPSGDAGGEPSGGNPGSPTGRNTVPFDLRVVDLVNHPDETTAFPPGRHCEHPAWWDYAGRWGVRVTPSTAGAWTHGDQRVDPQGRTLAYWNSAALAASIDG
ncbi:MAG TPA: hypothetical protein VGA69_02995 [Nitriliruptorales bacterium]